HRPAGCWPCCSFAFSFVRAGRGLKRHNERKLAARAHLALHPDLSTHGSGQTSRDGEAEAHAFLVFSLRQAEEVVEHLNVILRRNAGASIRNTYLHRVGKLIVAPTPFTGDAGRAASSALPHVWFGMKPHRTARRREL